MIKAKCNLNSFQTDFNTTNIVKGFLYFYEFIHDYSIKKNDTGHDSDTENLSPSDLQNEVKYDDSYNLLNETNESNLDTEHYTFKKGNINIRGYLIGLKQGEYTINIHKYGDLSNIPHSCGPIISYYDPIQELDVKDAKLKLDIKEELGYIGTITSINEFTSININFRINKINNLKLIAGKSLIISPLINLSNRFSFNHSNFKEVKTKQIIKNKSKVKEVKDVNLKEIKNFKDGAVGIIFYCN